jgi:hypothetical protein
VLAVYGDHNFTDVLVKHKIPFDKWPELTNEGSDNASQDNESWVQHAAEFWRSDQSRDAGTEDTHIGPSTTKYQDIYSGTDSNTY